MKNDKNKKHIINPTVNTIFIFDLQMSNNYSSVGFKMQQSKDDMLRILAKLPTIFIQSSRIFVQSLELWVQSVEKLVQLVDLFSHSIDKWA
jgi:hypothetical protein